jgi:hypothetical protein
MQSFVQETHVPEQPLQGLTLSGKFFDRLEEVKQEVEEEPKEDEDSGPKGHELLYQLWNDSDADFSYLREKVFFSLAPGKYEYLMKVCALLSSGESNYEGTLELSRMQLALSYIESTLKVEDLWLLAETSKTGEIITDEA